MLRDDLPTAFTTTLRGIGEFQTPGVLGRLRLKAFRRMAQGAISYWQRQVELLPRASASFDGDSVSLLTQARQVQTLEGEIAAAAHCLTDCTPARRIALGAIPSQVQQALQRLELHQAFDRLWRDLAAVRTAWRSAAHSAAGQALNTLDRGVAARDAAAIIPAIRASRQSSIYLQSLLETLGLDHAARRLGDRRALFLRVAERRVVASRVELDHGSAQSLRYELQRLARAKRSAAREVEPAVKKLDTLIVSDKLRPRLPRRHR